MNENATIILSIIGAAAWLPIIISPVINFFRNVQITLLDSRILTNATGISVNRKETKHGTIIMLAFNIYINKVTIFAKEITAEIFLKNGTKLKTELLDFSTLVSNNEDQPKSMFIFDNNTEFNISRTIHGNVDNIKVVAFLAESGHFASVDEIQKIELKLKFCKCFKKKASLNDSDFPRFNSARFFEKHEKVIK